MPKTAPELLILAPKMNVHLVPITCPQCNVARLGSVGDNLQSWCQQQISGFREDDPGPLIGQSLAILSSDWLTDVTN